MAKRRSNKPKKKRGPASGSGKGKAPARERTKPAPTPKKVEAKQEAAANKDTEGPPADKPAEVDPPRPPEERVGGRRQERAADRGSASAGSQRAAEETRPGPVAWAFGVVALASLAMVVLSGLWLWVGYRGDTPHAAMKDLSSTMLLGATMRSVHLMAGHLLLLALGAHLVALLLGGRPLRPAVGALTAGMLLVTVVMSCSGSALPWDRQAQVATDKATTLGASVPLWGAIQRAVRGGEDADKATHKRLYYLHVLPLPLPLLGLGLLLGRWRIRRREPGAESPPPVFERPGLAIGLVTALVLLVAGVLWQPALGLAADATVTITPAKAPWILAGWQEAASYAPWAGALLFFALAVMLALAPWLARPRETVERRKALLGAAPAVAVAAVTAAAVYWWRDPSYGAPSALNPATIALGATALMAVVVWRLLSGDRAAIFRAALAGLVATVVVLTAVGWLGRGPGWQLGWHPGQGVVGEAIVPQATVPRAAATEVKAEKAKAEKAKAEKAKAEKAKAEKAGRQVSKGGAGEGGR